MGARWVQLYNLLPQLNPRLFFHPDPDCFSMNLPNVYRLPIDASLWDFKGHKFGSTGCCPRGLCFFFDGLSVLFWLLRNKRRAYWTKFEVHSLLHRRHVVLKQLPSLTADVRPLLVVVVGIGGFTEWPSSGRDTQLKFALLCGPLSQHDRRRRRPRRFCNSKLARRRHSSF